jgi:integrase/recombinase XerD
MGDAQGASHVVDDRPRRVTQRHRSAQALEELEQYQEAELRSGTLGGSPCELQLVARRGAHGSQIASGEGTLEARVGSVLEAGHGAPGCQRMCVLWHHSCQSPASATAGWYAGAVAVLEFSGKRGGATLATSFQAFLSEIAQLDGLRPRTVRAYGYELAAAAADGQFGLPLDDIRREDLDAWLSRAPAATTTVGRRVATFRRFFVWACRQGLCRSNPMAERSPLRRRRHLPRPIREQQEQRALDAAIGTASQPYRLIFTILRETGMRVGEVLELRWGDVTLDSGREALRVREAKNGVERTVVLGPTATPRTLRGLRMARRTRGRTPADYELLFHSNRGTRVSYDALHYQWAKLCAAAGLLNAAGAPRYTPHQLRHTRGSDLIAQGQRVEIVQRVLGHRDIRSTLGYAELQEAQVRAALERQVPG